jgi:hypothetical protein
MEFRPLASLRQAIWLSVLLVGITVRAPLAYAQTRLTVEGTEFVLMTADGRVLRSPDLVGATLNIKTGVGRIEVTIKSVEKNSTAVGDRCSCITSSSRTKLVVWSTCAHPMRRGAASAFQCPTARVALI